MWGTTFKTKKAEIMTGIGLVTWSLIESTLKVVELLAMEAATTGCVPRVDPSFLQHLLLEDS